MSTKLTYLLWISFSFMNWAQQAPTPEWPLWRGNAAHQGHYPTPLPLPLKPLWKLRLLPPEQTKGEWILSSPVIQDQIAYLGDCQGHFYAIDLTTGKIKWTQPFHFPIDAPAAIDQNFVYFGCQDQHLYALDRQTGKVQWQYKTEGEIHAAPTLIDSPNLQQKILLIGSYDYKLYALDPHKGNLLWSAETGYYIHGSAAASSTHTYVGGCDNIIHELDLNNGKETHSFTVNAYVGNNVSIVENQLITAHYGCKVENYDLKKHQLNWQYQDRQFEYYASPAIHNPYVVIAGRDKRTRALDLSTGKMIWEHKHMMRSDSSPIICGDTQVITASDEGKLLILSLTTGQVLWQQHLGSPIKASPAVITSHLLIPTEDGQLHFFGP